MTEASTVKPGRGRLTAQSLELLRRYESPNVTYMKEDGSWPIIWSQAKGVHVWDIEGRKYLDLTAAFGVAAAGHGNRRVVMAAGRQMRRLLHGMGDVHPHPLKGELARVLSGKTFERWTAVEGRQPEHGRVIFGNSGFEAVEAALKTALRATGRRGVLAFKGGYHGLGYGTLNVTHRTLFRGPFLEQLGGFGEFLSFPTSVAAMGQLGERLEERLSRKDLGALVVEPIQARGGIQLPPKGFLKMLRTACDRYGVLLVLDEIYTGFGRTGTWFACEQDAVVPDLICLGKALTGGFPLSACVGRSSLMEAAWPKSEGEALHTSTFLGHPVGCAMALEHIREIERLGLVEDSATRGRELLAMLASVGVESREVRCAVRGRGLMVGVEFKRGDGQPATRSVEAVVQALLQRGFLVLPEGDQGEVLALTPPLTIRRAQLAHAVETLGNVVSDL